MSEQILIIDFGSQYTQLIARRVRELNVYCEIHPYNSLPENTANLKGVILSGSPCSVREQDAPTINLDEFYGKMPVLGICYGAQLMVHQNHGNVLPSKIREYGRARLKKIDQHHELLKEMTFRRILIFYDSLLKLRAFLRSDFWGLFLSKHTPCV